MTSTEDLVVRWKIGISVTDQELTEIIKANLRDYTLTQKQQLQQLQQLQQQLLQQKRQHNNFHQLMDQLIHQSQFHYKNLNKLSLMSQIIDK